MRHELRKTPKQGRCDWSFAEFETGLRGCESDAESYKAPKYVGVDSCLKFKCQSPTPDSENIRICHLSNSFSRVRNPGAGLAGSCVSPSCLLTRPTIPLSVLKRSRLCCFDVSTALIPLQSASLPNSPIVRDRLRCCRMKTPNTVIFLRLVLWSTRSSWRRHWYETRQLSLLCS